MIATTARLRLIIGDVQAIRNGVDPEDQDRLLRRVAQNAEEALNEVQTAALTARAAERILDDGIG